MRHLLRACALVACALFMLMPVVPALADFGDFDTGGDYGGGDYGGDSYDYDSGDNGDYGGSGSGLLGLLALFGFYGLAAAAKGGGERRAQKTAMEQMANYRAVMQPTDSLEDADPGFDRDALSAWVRELYAHMQADWEKGDISDLRREFDAARWSRFHAQLQQKLANGFQGHVRDIRYELIAPYGWCTRGDATYLDVRLKTSIISWNTDRSGNLHTGSMQTPKDMEYYWRLRRPADAKTDPEPRPCPACGAKNNRLMARCFACGGEIERDANAWVIWDITGSPVARVE